MFCTLLGTYTKQIRDIKPYRSRVNNLLFLAVDGNSLNPRINTTNLRELFINKHSFFEDCYGINVRNSDFCTGRFRPIKKCVLDFTESFANLKNTLSPAVHSVPRENNRFADRFTSRELKSKRNRVSSIAILLRNAFTETFFKNRFTKNRGISDNHTTTITVYPIPYTTRDVYQFGKIFFPSFRSIPHA